jgi:hypothetical protein
MHWPLIIDLLSRAKDSSLLVSCSYFRPSRVCGKALRSLVICGQAQHPARAVRAGLVGTKIATRPRLCALRMGRQRPSI